MTTRQVTGMLLALSLALNLSVVMAWAYYGRQAGATADRSSPVQPACETMREQLDLDESQWEAVEALRREFIHTTEPVRAQREQANLALVQAALDPLTEPEHLARLLDETADQHRRFQALAAEHLRQEAGVLTAEQRARMLEFLTTHIREGSCHRGLGLGMGMGSNAVDEGL